MLEGRSDWAVLCSSVFFFLVPLRVQTLPKKGFWGGFRGSNPSQEILGPLGYVWAFKKQNQGLGKPKPWMINDTLFDSF